MDGKTVQINLSGNTLEAVGVIKFIFENIQYIVYSLNEGYEDKGRKLDKVYVSEINAPVLNVIDTARFDTIKKVISEMGDTISTGLYQYEIIPFGDDEKITVKEPRKLATPKNICIELLKKSKKAEEEKKMVEEPQTQAAPMFVDPSMMEQTPTEPVQAAPVEASQNAFNMAPPVAESVAPVAPAEPVQSVESVQAVQTTEPVVAQTQEVTSTPVAPVQAETTYISTPIQPVAEVQSTMIETPAIAPVAPAEPVQAVQPTEPVVAQTQEATPTPVAPVASVQAEPTYISTAVPTDVAQVAPTTPAPMVEQPIVTPVESVQPAEPVQVAPAVDTLNPQVKEAFDTLLTIYNNDKNRIINDFNNYNPQVTNTVSPVETSNIDLNNIPVVQQEVQTEPLGEDRVFTGNTGPIPVVTSDMTAPVQETPQVATPVMEQPMTQEQPAPIAEQNLYAAQPAVVEQESSAIQPVATAPEMPVAVEQPMQDPTMVQNVDTVAPAMDQSVNTMEAPVAQAEVPAIQPLDGTETPNIDISTITNETTEQGLGMKLPDTPVQMPEGQINKVVGFGLMDGQPNNAQTQSLAA